MVAHAKPASPPCDCRPGVRLCAEARELSRRLTAAYGHAKATGDWSFYDLLRDEAERHIAHLQWRDE